MDCQTLSQAYQKLARETALEPLLLKALSLLRDYTEAQFGCILIESEDRWLIEGLSAVEDYILPSNVTVDCLPKLIVNHVANFQEIICLNSTAERVEFSNDPYFVERQPQSILCVPLCDRGLLEAIVYLENSSAKRVFTPKHLANLELLSPPIAIAIANARHYQKLNRSRQQNHKFLENLPVGVEVLDAEKKLYYINRRAREIRAKGLVAEVCPLSLVEAEPDRTISDNKLAIEIRSQNNYAQVSELEDNIDLTNYFN